MKNWYALSCPVCRLRHSLRRYTATLEPLTYPAQLVTGGGRASGFHTVRYVPWAELPSLREKPEVWRALNCQYIRLAGACDQFYYTLGFLSPTMREIIGALNDEVLRLRSLCRDLQDQLGRAVITTKVGGGELGGELSRILQTITEREEQDRRTRSELFK